jgi:hypothetical protein
VLSPFRPSLAQPANSKTKDTNHNRIAPLYLIRAALCRAPILIRHSPGGSLEAADQIVQYLRSKFTHIRAIVPQNAMSAAMMLACACDEIIMGKRSAIGPIDPQITFPVQNGHFTAPAQAILAEFDEAQKAVIADPRTAVLWDRFRSLRAPIKAVIS